MGIIPENLKLPKFSIGVGDRFGHQAKAQLRACVKAAEAGVEVAPVWNKSNEEHTVLGSDPKETREAVDLAVKELGYRGPYFLDADGIDLKTVHRFLDPCDFFTLDIAEAMGQPAKEQDLAAFMAAHPELIGAVEVPHIAEPFQMDRKFVEDAAQKFIAPVKHAAEIYLWLLENKGQGRFIPEISMQHAEYPQTPAELLILLAMIADEQIPVQTFAPKFMGRFDKGVEYAGDVEQFAHEFEEYLAVIAYAVKRYHLPDDLKLSVHSGSDKFSLYRVMHDGMKKFDAGVHIKTSGTTWLAELLGLAEADGDGLAIAKDIYADALAHKDELTASCALELGMEAMELPSVEVVNGWTSEQYIFALRHDASNPAYNPSFRQLLHAGFAAAARMGTRFTGAIEANEERIAKHVTENLYDRHIRPVFLGQ